MYNFKGISQQTLMLLEMNKFNNNKPFYEEHKKEINENARAQLGALSLDLADTLYALDENISVNPKKVSRIRRDTRFTKDKTLYRANVWTIWEHPKELGEMTPGLWVEFGPDFYSYGIGFWHTSTAFMEFFRKDLLENPSEFEKALQPLSHDGYMYDADRFKRDKPGTEKLPDNLKEIYNQKELFFLKRSADVSVISDSSFVDVVKNAIGRMSKMYKYFNNLYKRFAAEEE